jgi:hypothetical protein
MLTKHSCLKDVIQTTACSWNAVWQIAKYVGIKRKQSLTLTTFNLLLPWLFCMQTTIAQWASKPPPASWSSSQWLTEAMLHIARFAQPVKQDINCESHEISARRRDLSLQICRVIELQRRVEDEGLQTWLFCIYITGVRHWERGDRIPRVLLV